MSQMRRTILKTLHDIPSRGVMHNTNTLRYPASTLSSAVIPAEECEAHTLPHIFDIFDAPVRLGESSKKLRGSAPSPRIVTTSVAQQRNGENSRNATIDLFTLAPFSLPTPVVFDGPARPADLKHFQLETRRKMRQRLSPNLSRATHTPSIAFTHPADLTFEIFDGPSRITRYKYPTSPQSSTRPYMWLILSLSGALGWVAFSNELNSGNSQGVQH